MRILNRNRRSFEFFSLTNHFIDNGTFLADTLAREGRSASTRFGISRE
jgi:hypothetical protein